MTNEIGGISEKIKNVIIILVHDASLVNYSDKLQEEIFYIDGAGLDETPSEENKKMYDLFFKRLFEAINSGKEIFEIWYNDFIAFILGKFIKWLKKELNIEWIAITFFYNDETSAKIEEDQNYLLPSKNEIIEELEEHPYVYKFIIPEDFMLDNAYLQRLMREKNLMIYKSIV